MSNADLIAKWRESNPGKRITTEALKAILGAADLRYADLRYANLWDANLWDANLRDANLRGANLWGANLRCANLWGANLQGANLQGANLSNANWNGLQVNGLPSGQLILAPTPSGWTLSVGCWSGTIDELEALVAGDDWPEAEGEEILRRRPLLVAVIALGRAHIESNPGVVEQLAEKWAKSEVQA